MKKLTLKDWLKVREDILTVLSSPELKLPQVFYLVNNVDIINHLENGHIDMLNNYIKKNGLKSDDGGYYIPEQMDSAERDGETVVNPLAIEYKRLEAESLNTYHELDIHILHLGLFTELKLKKPLLYLPMIFKEYKQPVKPQEK